MKTEEVKYKIFGICTDALSQEEKNEIDEIMESFAKERAVKFLQWHYENNGALFTDDYTNMLYDEFIKK